MPISQQFAQQGQWLFKRRGYLPILLLIAGLVTYFFSINPGAYSNSTETYILMLSIFLSSMGMVIRLYTVGLTPDFTSGRNTADQVADQLNTTGIYSIVRHPLYLGNFFIYLGIGVLTTNEFFILIYIFIFIFYYERIMYAEERFLKEKFGDTFIKWSSNTPTIVPAFGRYKRHNLPFNWWKAFEREKSGIMSYFIVLFVFQVVRCFRIDGNYITECTWAFCLGITATAYYFTMKFIGKKKMLAPV